jgi:glucose/mannose-6-phosphate isomerase
MDYLKACIQTHKMISQITEEALVGQKLAGDLKIEKRPIIIQAMGGSALAAGMMANYQVGEWRLHEDYGNIGADILCSYSGNTEEIISGLGNNKVIITTGGKLAEEAESRKIPLILMPDTTLPRFSAGYGLGILSSLTDSDRELEKSVRMVDNQQIEEAKRICDFIGDRTPIFYAPARHRYPAKVSKIMFNELAKIPAFWNFFPEMNHNEMVSFGRAENYSIIFFRDKRDKDNTKRMEIWSSMIDHSLFIDIPDGHFFYQALSLLILVGRAATFLAEKRKVDPITIPAVENFKELMKSYED